MKISRSAVGFALFGVLTSSLMAQGSIASWGSDGFGQVTDTPPGTGFVQVAGGGYSSLALRADGSIVSWGLDNYGQVSNTPSGTGFVQVEGGHEHSLALFGTIDCNGNGIADFQDIANGTSVDCNVDGVPDECEITDDPTLDWNGDGVLDECTPANYCTANPNSTGQIAVMSASGSPIITDNNFTLTASQIPTFEWGYFMMAASQGFIPNVGGSSGNLCLGFPFYRFSKPPTGTVLSSGSNGTFRFTPNLTNLPQGVTFLVGETWDFQAWFRDGAAGTSNFTDGIEVMFR